MKEFPSEETIAAVLAFHRGDLLPAAQMAAIATAGLVDHQGLTDEGRRLLIIAMTLEHQRLQVIVRYLIESGKAMTARATRDDARHWSSMTRRAREAFRLDR